jgi:hypothetical protein
MRRAAWRALGIPRNAWNGAAALALALAAGSGCVGYIGSGESGSQGSGSSGGSGGSGDEGSGPAQPTSFDGPTDFSCNAEQKPAMDQLRALTDRQYLNTLSDLLTYTLGAPAAADVLSNPAVVSALSALSPNTPNLPPPLPTIKPAPAPGSAQAVSLADAAHNAQVLSGNFPDGGWLRADQSIQEDRVAAFYSVAVALGEVLSSNYLGPLVGNCALGTGGAADTSCLDAFIQGFGGRALRRAITSGDLTWYEGFYQLNGADSTLPNPAASGYQDVLTGFFASPEFLYFVEHGDAKAPANANGVYPLSSYELASRLSYQVWDTIPDATLWGHAVDGSISQAEVYKEEVDRLFQDPRAKQTLDQFFTQYFQAQSGLNYHNLAALGMNPNAQVKAFAGSDLPGPNLFQDMVADALGMVDYYSWTAPGTIHDLMTSGESFAQTKDVADIYKLGIWDGKSTPPEFPKNQRPGLFTRALFVAAGLETSPILKGVYFRRYVLCDELGPPPPAAAGKVVTITGFETTETATEQLTGSGICASCHPIYINPLGFSTESFDGLGRFRTHQTLYDTDGSVAASLLVNTAVTPRILESDSTTKSTGAADLMNLAEASNKPAACLARNYFRYSFARWEDVKVDGCSLEPMRKSLANGGHLADLWKSVVETPAFKQRTFL